ncbi:hypothetical protein CLU79DRAFT_740556 [Phycomyces nitens]|nr:hypothetical protein CLU79DRAFT_740556 [Phycomyces nitens]
MIFNHVCNQMSLGCHSQSAIDRLFNLRTKTLYVNEAFTLKAIKHTSPSESKVAYITGKKALGKIAVWRKRGQKRLKAAVRATFSQHAPPGYDYIFYIGPSTITSPWLDIVEQCKKSFSHIRRIAYPRSPKGHGENR